MEEQTNIAVLATDIKYIRQDIQEIKEQLKDHFVTEEEFEPVRKLVYGLVAVILMGVGGAILGLIIK